MGLLVIEGVKETYVWAWGFGVICCFTFVWINLLDLGCRNIINRIKKL